MPLPYTSLVYQPTKSHFTTKIYKNHAPSFSCWNQRQPAICKTNGITVKLRVMAGASFQTLFRWSIGKLYWMTMTAPQHGLLGAWIKKTGDWLKSWALNTLMEWGRLPNASNRYGIWNGGIPWVPWISSKWLSACISSVTISLGRLKVLFFFQNWKTWPGLRPATKIIKNPGVFCWYPNRIGILVSQPAIKETNLRLCLLDRRLKRTPAV